MANSFKIKAEFANHYVGFGNNTEPLGKVNQEGLAELALIGRQANDPSILRYFEGDLPSLEELQKTQTSKQKAASKDAGAADQGSGGVAGAKQAAIPSKNQEGVINTGDKS